MAHRTIRAGCVSARVKASIIASDIDASNEKIELMSRLSTYVARDCFPSEFAATAEKSYRARRDSFSNEYIISFV